MSAKSRWISPWNSRAALNAGSGPEAVITEYPARRRMDPTAFKISSSSSTTKITCFSESNGHPCKNPLSWRDINGSYHFTGEHSAQDYRAANTVKISTDFTGLNTTELALPFAAAQCYIYYR
jgi:hypothetical protein